MSLFKFIDELIPVSSGTNDGMTLAKLSARVKLWLSKTESRGIVDQVRWVPDLTNHTLAIGSELLAKVCAALELDYIPSECLLPSSPLAQRLKWFNRLHCWRSQRGAVYLGSAEG